MTRGERVVAFIEAYCRTPEGENVGKPIELLPFQKEFILAVYDNKAITRKAILSIGRKNGKSSLIACLVLAHLLGPEAKRNSHIQSGAQSRDQAALIFDLASKMIRMNDRLIPLARIVPSKKQIVGLAQNVDYKALAADGKTAHGGSPALLILDELGQVRGPRSDFVDALVTSQGAYTDPLLLVISTQAPGDNDLLSIWIDDAKDGKDPHTVCRVYSAPEGCEVTDKKAWKAANPAMGKFRSTKDIETKAEEAVRMPSSSNTFRNLYLNQRVSAASPFISRDSWNKCGKSPVPLSECELVYGGLDLSARTDLTSLVLIGELRGEYHVHPYFWTPEKGLHERAAYDRAPYDLWVDQGYIETTPGSTVDYEYVAHAILRLTEGCELMAIAYDRWRMDVLKKEFDRMGVDLPLTPWGQGFKDMAPALDATESMILNAKLHHGGNPVLTMCAANSKLVRNPAGDRKIERIRSGARIDGMVALVMACGVATRSGMAGTFDSYISNPLVL